MMMRWVEVHCRLRTTARMKTVLRVTLARMRREKRITQTRLEEEPSLAPSSEDVEEPTVRLMNLKSSWAVEAMATVS